MLGDPRTLDHRISVELIRLFYAMVFFSSFGAATAGVVGYFALRKPEISHDLDLWLIALLLCKGFQIIDAYFSRAQLGQTTNVKAVMAKLMIIHGLDSAIWTSLVWITLDRADMLDAVITLALITGITGGAVSLMSCLMPVMLTYFAVEVLVFVPKFFLLADPGYHTVAYMAGPYLFAMLVMGGNSNLAARRSVVLRFENQLLNENLRIEADKSRAAHQEAIKANVAKSRFLAAASHDLRQPIHAAGLFLEALHLMPMTRKQKPIIENAKSALSATSGLLDTLLDFSRIDAGVIHRQFKHFPLQPMLSELESEMGILADNKLINYRSRETSLVVYSDMTSVALILRNLISNAVRYTKLGGVLVAARRRGDMIQIEVWDTGIGIAKEQQEDIFLEFFQVDNRERDRRNGVGLGLSIASKLCESLGSKLHVKSTLGRGSLFYFQLPKGQADAVTASGQRVHTLPIQQDKQGDYILLIDDDEAVRAGMSALLDSWGLVHVTVATLEQARQRLAIGLPRLIISDLRLRGNLNGIAAIDRLRRDAQRAIPALLITGDTGAERLREVAQSGVHVLHKPVSPNLLAHEIAVILNPQP